MQKDAAADASTDLRKVIDALPHIAWVTSASGEVLYLNARWSEFTGASGTDRTSMADSLHPDDLDGVVEKMRQARTQEHLEPYDVRVRRHDGEYRWHRVNATPLRDEQGRVVQWIGTSTDVHEERLATAALIESEANYRFMVDSNPQVPWIADGNGSLIDFSDRWLTMTGLSREEALSNGWTEVPHPDDLPLMMEAFGRAMSGGQPLDIEHRARMANGEFRWMRTRAYPRFHEGRIVRWFGSTEDIHERKVAQEQLRQVNENLERMVQERTADLRVANEKLQRAYREAESFSYTASHDLRAPLRAVISTARMLDEDFGKHLPTEAHTLLKEQAAAAKRMADLIDALLTHSRIGRSEVRRSTIDLAELAEEVAQELSGRNATARVKIEPPIQAEGDPHLVRMVLQNLIENALLYSPDGSTVRVCSDNGACLVADEGIGFEMEYAAKIFEPFQRLHRDGDYPGTGIGLANAKKILELHGGSIWVESQPGHSSRFYFTLQ